MEGKWKGKNGRESVKRRWNGRLRWKEGKWKGKIVREY